MKHIEYDYHNDHRMEQYWSSWVRGLNNIDTKGLIQIKNLWKSGQILLVLEGGDEI